MNKFLAVYGKPRYLGIVEYEGDIIKGTSIIVESHRGEEIAVIAGSLTAEQEAEYRLLRNASEHGDAAAKSTEPVVTDLAFISLASDEEIETAEDYREEEKGILRNAKELLKPHDLDMKLIDVEFLVNRRKLFFYFSSEQRVDFRAYVRDLAREFKTRIELRQIGVRDEAKVIRGVGPCGQPCCCSYWLNQFAPICIKMVKEQNLALNPAKISGICGRLMCCMCFEHNVYHEMWEGLPNPGTKIKTPNGNVIVAGIELHTKKVRCFVPGRGEVKVPIDDFEEFKNVVVSGKEWIVEEVEEEVQPRSLKAIFPDFSSSFTQAETKSHVGVNAELPAKNSGSTDRTAESGEETKAMEAKRKRRRPKRPTGDNKEQSKAQQVKPQQNTNKGAAPAQNNSEENQQKNRRPRHRRSHKPADGKQTPVVKE